MKDRIVSLDWLRGLCAITIMLYHYSFVGKSDTFVSNIFAKLGIYGVSTFFVLSGLSMAIVYNNRLLTKTDSVSFFLKRVFRIVPLYALVCLLTIILNGVDQYSLKSFFINITVLFGFISPSSYIALGGWSIGNEMVYYLFTPFIILFFDKKRVFGLFILAIVVIVGFYFSLYALDPGDSLPNQWNTYINPFNNFYFFVTGIAIYYFFNHINIDNRFILITFFICMIGFILIPYYGNSIGLVTGVNRVFYSLIISVLVICCYKFKVSKIGIIGQTFEKFGIATYGVYLLHPIVASFLVKMVDLIGIDIPAKSIIASIITIALALFSYYYFELKVSSLGKRVIQKYIIK